MSGTLASVLGSGHTNISKWVDRQTSKAGKGGGGWQGQGCGLKLPEVTLKQRLKGNDYHPHLHVSKQECSLSVEAGVT